MGTLDSEGRLSASDVAPRTREQGGGAETFGEELARGLTQVQSLQRSSLCLNCYLYNWQHLPFRGFCSD